MTTDHKYGEFESIKFHDRREDYCNYIKYVKENVSKDDLLHQSSAFLGHMSLNRILTLYELYKKVQNIAGHIAEVGVYKGAGTLLFAKLVHIFESESLTQVHGFDWFKGTTKGGGNDNPDLVPEGGYVADYDSLMSIVKLQKLDHIIRIHNFDVRNHLQSFFDEHKHLQFKLIFMDAGMYEVMQASIPLFYDRLIPGGIMIFDQFVHEFAPGETISVREIFPNAKIHTIPNSWMPNAYIIKD